jgi:hypothetical protein
MKLIKFTSILLCIILLVSVFTGCDTTEESKSDTSSKDPLLNTSEDVSETVSEEVLEEISEEVSQVLGFVIVDKRDEMEWWDDAIDTFYRDETYEYNFPGQPMHKYVIVEYEDGTTQNVKEALEDGNITIADLDRFNIEYLKNPIEE